MAKIGRDRHGRTTLNGAPIWWPNNKDESGVNTFALPGETAVSSEEMRYRTREYYAQVRGNPAQYNRKQRAAENGIQAARDLLSD